MEYIICHKDMSNEDFIMHAGGHKYLDKIFGPDGTVRYIYDTAKLGITGARLKARNAYGNYLKNRQHALAKKMSVGENYASARLGMNNLNKKTKKMKKIQDKINANEKRRLALQGYYDSQWNDLKGKRFKRDQKKNGTAKAVTNAIDRASKHVKNGGSLYF